ncbi:MAG TPA: DUF5658 family protein [Planktothrix sp.]
MKLCKENWLILIIGTIDLFVTVVLLHGGTADEANPLFHRLLSHGLPVFVLIKAASLIGPVAIFEYARKAHPEFVRKAQWFTIIAYLVLYVLGVLSVNYWFMYL